jgi:hypothetical protein
LLIAAVNRVLALVDGLVDLLLVTERVTGA